MSSRTATKALAREHRIALERAHAHAALRRRRLRQLAVLVAAAAAVIAALIVISAAGEPRAAGPSAAGEAPSGIPASTALLAGIPQQGLALGRPDAPVTLIEYGDLQCPACRMYSEKAFPTLVRDYVRSGRLRLEIRLQSFLGPDSVTAAGAVAAASLQDRAWPLIDLFYRNQGEENSGYVTDGWLASLGKAVPGIDVPRMLRERSGARVRRIVADGSAEFAALGLKSTPSFQIGRTNGAMHPLEVSSFGAAEFTSAVDAHLSR
jgi:protein-disulfide isomerase